MKTRTGNLIKFHVSSVDTAVVRTDTETQLRVVNNQPGTDDQVSQAHSGEVRLLVTGQSLVGMFHQYSHALKALIKLEFVDNINVRHYVDSQVSSVYLLALIESFPSSLFKQFFFLSSQSFGQNPIRRVIGLL